MNYPIKGVYSPRGGYPGPSTRASLPLSSYLELAERCIMKFAPDAARPRMLGSEDAISHVCERIILADLRYDPGCGTSRKTYRISHARWAIGTYAGEAGRQSTGHEPPGDDTPDPRGLEPHEALERLEREAEQWALVEGASRLLADNQRAVLGLHCGRGLTYRQIAGEMGVTRQLVRQTMGRAVAGLKELIDI